MASLACLACLPNEVIRLIFSFIHPQDLESFAGVCKRNYNLSSDFLELHRENQLKYRRIADQETLTIPRLLETPLLASYIKRLVFSRARFSTRAVHLNGSTYFADREYASYYSGEKLDDIRTLLGKSGLVEPQDLESVVHKIETGKEEWLAMLLLSFATTLEHLVIAPAHDRSRMLIGHLAEYLRTAASMPKHVQPVQFKSLSLVFLNHRMVIPRRARPALLLIAMESIAPFLTLPTIDALVVDNGAYADSENSNYMWEFEPRSSNLSSLDLRESYLHENELDQLLEGIRALSSFRMCGPPKGIEDILQRFTSSLEEMEVWHSHDERPLPSLRGFQRLRVLGLCVCRLYTKDSGMQQKYPKVNSWTRYEVVKLQDILPSTIDILTLRGCESHQFPLHKLVSRLAELVESKPLQQRCLQDICLYKFRNPSGNHEISWDKISSIRRLKDTCATHNVKLSRCLRP